MLAEHLKHVERDKKIAFVKATTKTTILRITENELSAATKKHRDNVVNFQSHLKKNSVLDIEEGLKASFKKCSDENPKFALDEDYIKRINAIIADMKREIRHLETKAQNTQDYIQLRINDSKAKQAEDKDGQQEEKQNDLVNVSYTDIKNEMGDILKQAKEINSLISGRDKKINKATESKIEMALQFIYSQLEVMLDKNIYLQFIQRNGTHDLAVNFVGHGWVKSIGASLHQVKSVFAKYQELHAYFSERNLTTTYLIHTPKEGLLDFAKKTRELAIVSKQLVASIISLEKRSFR